MNVAAYIPGVLKVALTMVKIFNCDYFHFRSLFFRLEQVVTLWLHYSSFCYLLCYWCVCVCDKVMFPWYVNINSIQRLWDTLYLDVSLLVVMVWTEASC